MVKRFGFLDADKLDAAFAKLDMMAREIGAIKDMLQPKGQLTVDESGKTTQHVHAQSADASIGHKQTVLRFNKEGPTIADFVYQSMNEKSFSPKEAHLAISGHVALQSKRPIDSVRAALERDQRFEKVKAGKYRKILR